MYLQQEGLLTALTNLQSQLHNEKVDKESNKLVNEIIDIGNDTEKAVIDITGNQDSGNQEDLASQLTSTTPHVPSEITTTIVTTNSTLLGNNKTSKSSSLTTASTPPPSDQT